MSIFRKPKKAIQRRVFSSYGDDGDEDDNENNNSNDPRDNSTEDVTNNRRHDNHHNKKTNTSNNSSGGSGSGSRKEKDVEKTKKSSLLSFDDEDEGGGEIFQVKKSSHSKKVMKMMNKERRKKKSGKMELSSNNAAEYTGGGSDYHGTSIGSSSSSSSSFTVAQSRREFSMRQERQDYSSSDNLNIKNRKNLDKSNSIQTEIRTDDFVLVVKKTEPPPQSASNMILNGRAALCAGKNDLSSEDDENDDDPNRNGHRFSKPDHFKTMLENGLIPDAAMIHAARKRRQKAREEGDFIPIEENPIKSRKSRLIHEDGDDDGSEEEQRVDMAGINEATEREERLEQFYSVQQEYSGEETDLEMNEWENQQIRKGVTGAQLNTAQNESVFYTQYLLKTSAGNMGRGGPVGVGIGGVNSPGNNNDGDDDNVPMSTGNLLEQAYARSCLEKPRQMILSTQKETSKPSGPRMPDEVVKKLSDRLVQVQKLHQKHVEDIEDINRNLKLITIEEIACKQNAPIAAVKYRFYQELRAYVSDLFECLNEKVPLIVELERKALSVMSKQATMLIERRRQDVRDQAKEIAESGKPGASRKMLDDEERVRRAADREGRRTRRRQIRERIDINNQHLDGMSSDDEVHQDHDAMSYRAQLDQLSHEVNSVMDDVSDEFSQISSILDRFEEWRKNDITTYSDTYFNLCLPKILGPMIRLNLVTWNPLEENCQDLERMDWYNMVMKYSWSASETEESLSNDPDVRLIPVLVEKIILPKITEIIETCWDPISTTQTLKLVGVIGRLGREYPSLKPSSTYLRTLFITILDKMKLSLENDVFIPIFPKQMQEARSSFFQRQFCSGLKLFRNLLSWQGILADVALKELAISSLLNRYLLSAMRVCTPVDATAKAYQIVNTLPRIWLQPENEILDSLEMFKLFLKQILSQLDGRNVLHLDTIEKMSQIMHSLHTSA